MDVSILCAFLLCRSHNALLESVRRWRHENKRSSSPDEFASLAGDQENPAIPSNLIHKFEEARANAEISKEVGYIKVYNSRLVTNVGFVDLLCLCKTGAKYHTSMRANAHKHTHTSKHPQAAPCWH